MNLIQKLRLYYGLRSVVNGRAGTQSVLSTAHQRSTAALIAALTERIYREMIAIMAEFEQLHSEDFDLLVVKEKLIRPAAQYLVGDGLTENGTGFVTPIFVFGQPGIGKTTLLMVLDEALYRLGVPDMGSARDVMGSGNITSYFAEKGVLSVTPLSLFDRRTAVLSARDWNNVLRHWTYDENAANQSEMALTHFAGQLHGKVVMVDEAEIEGYVYFTEVLAQHGILVLLSSNLGVEHIHLAPAHVSTVELRGSDHRKGDITKVCLPNTPQEWFDRFSTSEMVKAKVLAGAKISSSQIYEKQVVYLKWDDLQNRPLLKDDFARFFKDVRADGVLLDQVPFFSEINANDVDLTFLGQLFRFVNFVDAIHDCRLPLLVRGTQSEQLDSGVIERKFQATLAAYDKRTGGTDGQAAWIEWSRCLSRLRSREALNDQVWS